MTESNPILLPSSPAERRTAARQALYRQDFNEFFRRELKIGTKALGAGMMPFIPNATQVDLINNAHDQLKRKGKIRQLIYKGRQIGGSTYSEGILWNRASLYPGVNTLSVAQDRTTAANLFNMLDTFWRGMSNELRPFKQYHTKGFEMVLGNGNPESVSDMNLFSRLATAESKNAHIGVGHTLHALHLSEVCRYPTMEPIVESLLPACSEAIGTVKIVESTPWFGGGSEWFRDQCDRAIAGKSEYEFVFSKWWLNSEYSVPLASGEKLKLDAEERYLIKKIGLTPENIKWRRLRISELNGDIDMFRMSWPLSYEDGWITKASSTFPYDRLMEMQSTLCPPARRFSISEGRVFEDPEHGQLWVWKMPEEGKVYDVGADVGGGNEDGDWSVAEVLERFTNEQVAEWRGHPLPREFGDILAAIGRMYNHAQVGPEINNLGVSTMERLREVYSEIYLWRKRDTLAPKITGKLGWQTTSESKSVMVNLTREKIYYRQLTIHSKILWDELRLFVQDWTPTGIAVYHAATGHDDAVLALLIAIQISDDENFEKYSTISVRETHQEKPKDDMLNHDVYRDSVGLGGENMGDLSVDTGSWR